MAELLSTATTAASSSDIVVADGGSATIFLKGADGVLPANPRVLIEVKDSDGNYGVIGELDGGNKATVISGKGTYRVRRLATGASVGVEQG